MDLRSEQLKDTYGNLVTTGTTAGSPTSGGLQNGQGTLLTSVGIGTNSPNQLLEVANSSGGATINISTDQTAGSIASKKFNNLDFSGFNNSVLARIQSWDESSSTGHGYLTFHTFKAGGSLTEQMRIDYNGNVGIGTDTPGAILDIKDNNPQIQLTDSVNASAYSRILATDAGALIIDADKGNAGTSSYISLRVDNSEKMLIDSSGNVGIGETNPTAPLQIKTDTSAGNPKVAQFLTHADVTSGTEVRLAFAAHTNTDIATDRYSYISALNTSGSNGQALVFATNGAGAGGTERMRIDSSGNVGIGNTSVSSINSASGLGNLVVGDGGASSQGITIFTGSATIGALNFADATSGGGAYAGYISFDHPTDSFGVFTGNVKRVRIDADGLKFGADTATANALDDYEEGTWTPAWDFVTTGDLSVTYTAQTGTYTKIGDVVILNCIVNVSAFTYSTASGNLKLIGLPYNVSGAVGVNLQGWTKTNYTQIQAQGSGSFIQFIASGSGQNRSLVSSNDIASGSDVEIRFSGAFKVT